MHRRGFIRLGAFPTCFSATGEQKKRRLRAMQGPRTMVTAWAVIQEIEGARRIRKGQVLPQVTITCGSNFRFQNSADATLPGLD